MRESSLETLLLLATLFVIHEKHAKALTLLEGLFELAPRDERVLRLLCHSLVRQKLFERALEMLRDLSALAGNGMSGRDRACALRLRAAALWGLNRGEEARALLEQSIAAIADGMPEAKAPTQPHSSLSR
jgi:tetratricopeptide (TPR) repeat protein